MTCACVVCHCACVLALPMGAIPSGGLHVIGRIAPDQLGLNLPDRVFHLIGNNPRLGAGRPWRPSSLPATPFECLSAPRPTRARAAGPRQRLPTGVYRRPVLPAPAQPVPVQQGPVGDSLPALIGAPPYPRPCNRAPSATPYRPLSAHAEQSRASGGALDPLGSMTPGVMVGVLQH